jgi:hypothetical protein
MKRIKIDDCSVRVRLIAEPLGFKTLASFHKFVKKCDTQAKLYFNGGYMMAPDVLKTIEREYQQPVFKHDCHRCRFLGHRNSHDLYACGSDSVVARYGNDGPDYVSDFNSVLDSRPNQESVSTILLKEAFKRSKKLRG